MRTLLIGVLVASLIGCSGPADEPKSSDDDWVDLSKHEKPDPVIRGSWDRVVIQAYDIEDLGRFWTDIAGYETVEKSASDWTLRAPGTIDGYISLSQSVDADALPVRPATARAWDTGCYWSIMMRAKDLETIITDAAKLGWEPLTEMAYLEFGPSKLYVVVLTHMKTGTRIQLYERLTTPLPEGFPEFERVSRPFNIMQMADDRDAAYDFFQQVLGFETFYYGKPYVSPKEEVMPLGLPPELTTTVPYKAAIVYPEKGMEWGRFEMIEIDGMTDGADYAKRCGLEQFGEGVMGTIGVVYSVENLDVIKQKLDTRGAAYKSVDGLLQSVIIESPDGAMIAFEQAEPK
jgi:hypothetical protein